MRIGTLDDASYGEAIFDVAAGTVVGSPVVAGSATSPVADIKYYRAAGFYRCRLSVSRIDAPSTSCRSKFFVLQDDSTVTYAGDGTSFIYGWGLQHERNPSPSSYIPTVSTIITRAVDRFALTDLSWFNALEGNIPDRSDGAIRSRHCHCGFLPRRWHRRHINSALFRY
jgi:hypothetical protein